MKIENDPFNPPSSTPLPVVSFNEDFIVQIWFSLDEWEGEKYYRVRLKTSRLSYTVTPDKRGYTVHVTVNLKKVAYLLGLLNAD